MRDREVLETLDHREVAGVSTYELGSGPVIVAVHGWGGRPAQMVPAARRLADDGYRVVVPELPGHGGGPTTDIKQSAAALRAVIAEVGEPRAIVAHSFAAMVLRLAFPETGPDQVVLVAPALNVNDALDTFGDKLRLLPWSRSGLRRRLKQWDLDLWPIVSTTNPDVMRDSQVLIFHDPEDGETSFARSAEFAALRPGVSLVPSEGVGHNRILADPAVHDRVAAFVRRKASSAA